MDAVPVADAEQFVDGSFRPLAPMEFESVAEDMRSTRPLVLENESRTEVEFRSPDADVAEAARLGSF